jgi:hypothetical protein
MGKNRYMPEERYMESPKKSKKKKHSFFAQTKTELFYNTNSSYIPLYIFVDETLEETVIILFFQNHKSVGEKNFSVKND